MKLEQLKLKEDVKESPELYVLVGLPGSGKSTWTKNFLASSSKSFVIVSSDDVLEKLAKSSNSSYNEMYVKNFRYAEKEMNRTAEEAIQNRQNVIWDQTNLRAKKRAKILARIPKEYFKTAVVFEVGAEELYNRLNTREKETGKKIPMSVVVDMRNNYEEPTTSEGFDKILKIKG